KQTADDQRGARPEEERIGKRPEDEPIERQPGRGGPARWVRTGAGLREIRRLAQGRPDNQRGRNGHNLSSVESARSSKRQTSNRASGSNTYIPRGRGRWDNEGRNGPRKCTAQSSGERRGCHRVRA